MTSNVVDKNVNSDNKTLPEYVTDGATKIVLIMSAENDKLKNGLWNVTRSGTTYTFIRHSDMDGSPASELVTNRTTYVIDNANGSTYDGK